MQICLSGMNTIDQIAANTRQFEPLTDRELFALSNVRDIIEKNTAVSCTGCRYCEPHCPVQIRISDMMNQVASALE